MYRTDNDELEIKELKRFLSLHDMEIERYKKLQRYYEGKHDIMQQKSPDEFKIANPYPRYITDMLTGYFLGRPVAYVEPPDGNTEFFDRLMEIYDYNDEQEENMELAKTASIKGCAYELLWTDDNAQVRFKDLQPDEMFFVHDNTLDDTVRFAVRTYQRMEDMREIRYVEVYDAEKIRYYDNRGGDLELKDEVPHHFGDVPAIRYENNSERLGDFEHVLSLIDAYDRSQSNTLNDMAQFTDAFLVLVNMAGTDDEDVKKMKSDRVLLIDDNGDARWLVKEVNDAWVENFKKRVKDDIHKFSFTPDMSDERFGNNVSGVSLRYKLLGMEQLRSNKERKFKSALLLRMELISNFLSITNNNMDYRGIGMRFDNILPQNILEVTQIIQNLSPYLSTETLINLLPFVENAADEIDKKKAEEDSYTEDYSQLLTAAMTARTPRPTKEVASDEE